MKHGLVLTALLALPVLAQAQTIWRCGPDGRSFSDTPCAEGRALAAPDARPADDITEARALAAREKRLAETLRRERLREEFAQRGNGLAAVGPVQADPSLARRAGFRSVKESVSHPPPRGKKPLALRTRAPSGDETFRAVGPASRRNPG